MLKRNYRKLVSIYIFNKNIPKSVHYAAYKRQGEQRKLN